MKLAQLKEAISAGTTQGIKDAMNALNQEVMQLGQSVYSQPGAAGAGPALGPQAGPSSKAPDDVDVIDADLIDSNEEV